MTATIETMDDVDWVDSWTLDITGLDIGEDCETFKITDPKALHHIGLVVFAEVAEASLVYLSLSETWHLCIHMKEEDWWCGLFDDTVILKILQMEGKEEFGLDGIERYYREVEWA